MGFCRSPFLLYWGAVKVPPVVTRTRFQVQNQPNGIRIKSSPDLDLVPVGFRKLGETLLRTTARTARVLGDSTASFP